MTKQTKAIGRLVDIKEKAVSSAEATLAKACRETALANEARDRAVAAWTGALDAPGEIASVADLADHDVRLRRLRRLADQAEREVVTMMARESHATFALTTAKLEHRRYETFLERKARELAGERRRIERLAEDEVCARKRTGSAP